MKHKWVRELFSRELPLEGTPLTASFEVYNNKVVGIHLHDCFITDGIIDKEALRIVEKFRSRVEYDETGKGVYILVKGTLPFYSWYEGLKLDTYYLTGRTIVYGDIIENTEALEWFVHEFNLDRNDESTSVSNRYYRSVSMEGDILKISMPNVKKGSRHKTLLSYGGRLLSEGYSMDRVEVKMYDFNLLYCVPPLPFEEFQSIVESVKKYSIKE